MLTEDRVNEMLCSALVAFHRAGIDAMTLTELAGFAGIPEAEFTARFATRDEVFRAIVIREVVEPMARACAELPPGAAPDQLRNYCGRIWEIMNSRRFAMIYRLLVTDVHGKPWLARLFAEEIAGSVCRQLETIVASGVAGGEFRAVSPASAARAIAGSLVTQAYWCNHLESWGPALCGVPSRVVPETVGLILGGLHRDGSAALLTTNGEPR